MERIDDLQINGYKLIQDDNFFCFGIDAVLLSDFAKNIKNNSKVIDLGTGNGILPVLLCAKTSLKEITGIEIQQELSDLAKRNSKLNNLEDKFKVINEDLNNLYSHFTKNYFDAIVTNPPYKKLSTRQNKR